MPTCTLIQARVRFLTSRASVSMYSNAVRTDCDVILGLVGALIAACESFCCQPHRNPNAGLIRLILESRKKGTS